jgi:hypothetical protein
MPRTCSRKLCDIPCSRGAELATLQALLRAREIASLFHIHDNDGAPFYRVWVRNVHLDTARTIWIDLYRQMHPEKPSAALFEAGRKILEEQRQ